MPGVWKVAAVGPDRPDRFMEDVAELRLTTADIAGECDALWCDARGESPSSRDPVWLLRHVVMATLSPSWSVFCSHKNLKFGK